jgi:hypothetical protein
LVTSAGLISAREAKIDSANDLALLKAKGRFAASRIISSVWRVKAVRWPRLLFQIPTIPPHKDVLAKCLAKLTKRLKYRNLNIVDNDLSQHCYLCDIPVRKYELKPGEKHRPYDLVPDHVPPKCLFPEPRPDNLIAIPCCFECNNKHSGFDERLRIVASIPFDRNEAGQKILDEKVVGGSLAKGRQMRFLENLLASMKTVPEHPERFRFRTDDREFREGMIRIAKGLLFNLHPSFDYRSSTFNAIDIHQKSFDEQLRLMARLKQQGLYFERGQRVFQCWRHVEESRCGVWMLVLYECFGFFVVHTNGSELDKWKP